MAQIKIKAADKPKRKDDLDPTKDKFITRATTFFDWAYERRRPVALLIGLVLLVAVVGILINHFSQKGQAEDSAILGNGLDAATAPIIPAGDDKAAAPSKKNKQEVSFETMGARATEAIKKFAEAEGKTNSRLALISVLGEAAAHLDIGEYDKAKAGFDKFLASADAPIAYLRPVAIEGLGYALEGSGKIDEALARFEELGAKSAGPVAAMARYQAARLALKKKDSKKAKQLLSEVIAYYKEKGRFSPLDHVFLEAREDLLALDPKADIPAVPKTGLGGLEGIDPELLRQLIEAQAGGGPS